MKPDAVESGKMLSVFSFALLIFSIHGYYTMQNVQDSIVESEQAVQDGLSYVNSAETQRIMEALQDVQGVTQEFRAVEQGFNEARESLEAAGQAREKVESTKNHYQWMVVLSTSGIVAGILVVLLGRH